MVETWYIMEDGSVGDPREVSMGPDGKLTHTDGRKVAYAPHGPRSRGVDPEAERAKGAGGQSGGKPVAAAPPRADPPAAPAPADAGSGGKVETPPAAPSEGRDMTAAKPKPYKTRESKAR